MKYIGQNKEVRVSVKDNHWDAKNEGLDRIRSIVADSKDEAARKYVELITGRSVGIYRSS